MQATEKISVTLDKKELGHAKRLAARLGVSLSGFISQAVRERVREQERREAALELVASFPAEDRATPEEAEQLLKRWATPVAVKRKTSKKMRASRAKRR